MAKQHLAKILPNKFTLLHKYNLKLMSLKVRIDTLHNI